MTEPFTGRMLVSASDVTDDILVYAENVVDWFQDGEPMPTEEFLDRLCDDFGGNTFDLDSYDNAAARKIMRHARAFRRGSE